MVLQINKLPNDILIGRQTENGVNEIEIDVSEWLERWPGMNISIMHTRPGETYAYPAATHMTGSCIVWEISNADTAIHGLGTVEIMGILDGKKKLSRIVQTHISKTTTATTSDIPEAAKPWVDMVINAAGEIKGMTATAETLQPGEAATASYADGQLTLGIPRGMPGEPGAKGDKGDPGPQGDPGSDASVTAANIESALGYAPVTPSDLAAKQDALTDADRQSITKTGMTTGAAWTANEQKAARERMGIPGNFELLHSITVGEGGAARVDIPSFPALHHIMALVTLPPIASFGFFLAAYLDNSGKNYIAGSEYGNASHALSIRFEIVIEGGIMFARSSGKVVDWGGGYMFGPNNAGQAVFAKSITSAYFYTPGADKVIPETTKIEIYGVKI